MKTWRAISDLISLTKPGIMVFQLASTTCGLALASRGQASLTLWFWTLLGGALLSGSASAANCVYDRDIDALMRRTSKRAIPAGRLSARAGVELTALLFALGLWVLLAKVNFLAAAFGVVGYFIYVVIYTIWLKRASPQNIVIGGAAGSMPPLVGWTAVTGQIGAPAVWLALLVFLWTPPHVWALAVNKNEDYRRAGVPMLPVVAGERATVRQMLLYAGALVPVTMAVALTASPAAFWSVIAAGVVSLVFLFYVFQLYRALGGDAVERARRAWRVFWTSLAYLVLVYGIFVAGVLASPGQR